MMVNGAESHPHTNISSSLLVRLFAADAAVTQALDTRPPGRWHWMWRRAAAQAAARVRPDVVSLAETAWTLLGELSTAEAGDVTAQCAARRLSGPPALAPAPAPARRPLPRTEVSDDRGRSARAGHLWYR